MPAFPLKVRTLESYLAGLGASGALIAGAFVASVLLVGIVTFDAWPTGSSVFSRGGSGVSVDTSLTTSPPAQQAKVPNLIKLLGAPSTGGAASRLVGSSGGSSNGPSTGSGRSPQREPQTTNPGGGGQQPSQPSNPTQSPQSVGSASNVQTSSPNLLQQTISGVGNNLQNDTDSLSNTLGGQDTLLGGVVGGLGSTLNNTLQGLAGTGG